MLCHHIVNIECFYLLAMANLTEFNKAAYTPHTDIYVCHDHGQYGEFGIIQAFEILGQAHPDQNDRDDHVLEVFVALGIDQSVLTSLIPCVIEHNTA